MDMTYSYGLKMDAYGSDIVLKGITPIEDKELGWGAYGRVYAVKYFQMVCAAKEIYLFYLFNAFSTQNIRIKCPLPEISHHKACLCA